MIILSYIPPNHPRADHYTGLGPPEADTCDACIAAGSPCTGRDTIVFKVINGFASPTLPRPIRAAVARRDGTDSTVASPMPLVSLREESLGAVSPDQSLDTAARPDESPVRRSPGPPSSQHHILDVHNSLDARVISQDGSRKEQDRSVDDQPFSLATANSHESIGGSNATTSVFASASSQDLGLQSPRSQTTPANEPSMRRPISARRPAHLEEDVWLLSGRHEASLLNYFCTDLAKWVSLARTK